MFDIDHIYFDADCLLAESCLAIYEAIDQPNQTNEEQNRDNQNNQVNNKPTPPNNTNHSNVQQHQQSPTDNNKPSNGNSIGVNNKPVNGGKTKEERKVSGIAGAGATGLVGAGVVAKQTITRRNHKCVIVIAEYKYGKKIFNIFNLTPEVEAYNVIPYIGKNLAALPVKLFVEVGTLPSATLKPCST